MDSTNQISNSHKHSNPSILHNPLPPLAKPGWYTTRHVAKLLDKSRRTIQVWCEIGFLVECGYKVVLQGQSGSFGRGNKRWLIYIPSSEKLSGSLPVIPSLATLATLASAQPTIDLSPVEPISS